MIIENFNRLNQELPKFKDYNCIVILAKYNFGKSSICTDLIHGFFGEEKTYYVTFTDQSKENFKPRTSRLRSNELVEDKIIVFDEINDEKERDLQPYLKELIKKNKVIILSSPYGSSAPINFNKLAK